MRARRRLLASSEGTWEIWPAFTDVMSTLALVLFVLVLLAYVRNLIDAKQLDALQGRIGASERALRQVDDQLRRATADLEGSRARLKDQERTIADANTQLGTLRARLQGIAVLRVEVLTKLKDAIEEELGPSNEAGAALVTFGDNGDVVLNESLVFESGSYALKPAARPLLDGLARALGKLLANDAVRENIEAIVIQGHADERGSAAFNWDLSAKRATAVLDYLFHTNPVLADSFGRYFAASAYSNFRPLSTARTPEAYQENRRIEIAVVPRDANVKTVIDDYVRGLPAEPVDAGP